MRPDEHPGHSSSTANQVWSSQANGSRVFGDWIRTLILSRPPRSSPHVEELPVTVKIEKSLRGTEWLVKLNNYQVTFSSAEQAKAFVDKLKSRIEAPHVLPR